MMVSVGRFSDNLCFDYYDMQWNKTSLLLGGPNSDINHLCPLCFEEMKKLCRKLSKDIPHVRCDFYIVNNRPLFGELTFFDGSGLMKFLDHTWNYKLGAMLELPL